MRISVVIPTYRRVQSLERCFQGLRNQSKAPYEVLVVARCDDEETIALCDTWKDWKVLALVLSEVGGLVYQLNIGLGAMNGDIVAITDDDAIPREEWLQHIDKRFTENPYLGGVGGPDFVTEDGVFLKGSASRVGKIQWFGRVVGNHHLGTSIVADVDTLKGVNMAFRTAAIAGLQFDRELRGAGAQVCSDMAFSLAVKKRGWKLLFDSAIAVEHYPARRHDHDQRGAPSMKAIEEGSFNFYLTLRRHMKQGTRQKVALLWALWIGRKNSPGRIRGILSMVRRDGRGIDMRKAAKTAWLLAEKVNSTELHGDGGSVTPAG